MPTFRDDPKIGSKVPMVKTADLNDACVTGPKILDGCITKGKIAVGAVDDDIISNGSIVTSKLADGNVTTDKLADQSVKTSKLADANVTTSKLADQSVDNSKLAPSSVSYDKLQDSSVITEKLNDRAVTTEKLEEKAIVNPKLGDQSVDSRVLREANVLTKHIANEAVTTDKVQTKAITKDKLADNAVDSSQVVNGSIVNSKLDSNSVTTDKIKDSSVTNAKLADNTITINKFDPELRKSLQAATGLPDNLLEMVQDVDISIAELQDSVFPITLGFSVTPDVKAMQTAIAFSVKSKGSPFLPDTLKISKTVNNGVTTLLADAPSSSGSLSTPISGAKEQFTFEVTKEGRTGKSTSATRFLCYYGSSSVATASEAVLNSLQKVSTTGLSFNPTITTRSGDYIWLVVPNDLTISRVTSAGFDVTLASAQTVTNSLGTFKAYRTANTLTAETWKLVIS